jgi:hypothetical protein
MVLIWSLTIRKNTERNEHTMKKLLLAVALAPFALGFSMANATSVTTDPVGFVKVEAAPGTSALGVAMVNPAAAAGLVVSATGTTITVNGQVADLPAGPHFVEIVKDAVNGALVGDRFDIASVSGNQITLDVGPSSYSTIKGALPSGLADANFVVRKHVTLGQLGSWVSEGTQIVGHPFPANADQIRLFRNGQYRNFYHTGSRWQEGSVDATNLVVAPGEGFFYVRRGAAALKLTTLGEVRTNDFRQPLAAGVNFVSTGFPVPVTPAERGFSVDGGFTAHPFPANADQVRVWEGSQFGSYHLASGANWQRSGFPNLTSFDPAKAVFVVRRTADADFYSPKPF